jgi:S-DNA-T family DNA segregation ATPase FtsK/SpoIIIE
MRRNYGSRHGRYPVVMLGDYGYQPLGIIALAAIGRAVYRHRSAFLPVIIAAAAFTAAAVLHQDHPGSWVTVAAVTATTGVFLGIPRRLLWNTTGRKIRAGCITRAWEACGITRPAERAYATVVTVAAGGWLSAAIDTGPAMRPLPAVAGIATVILGIPWWAHRRRRQRVRIERTVQAWPGMAESMGLPGSRIASASGDIWGFTARLVLRKGTTAVQAINQIPAIESGLGAKPGSVRVTPDPARADRAILRVIETDPHAAPIVWPGITEAAISAPVEIGLFEDGRLAAVLLLRRNALIGGIAGAGKSGILNVILAFLVTCPDVILWGIDLKGGMELQPWAQCLHRLATTAQEATALFADAVAELDNRAAWMTAQRKRLWEPSTGMPALIIVIDEYAELPAEAQEFADSAARRGRAVAVNILAATQRPTQDAMGGNAVRSQMDVRICLRVRERRDVDLILGQGSLASGWQAHTLAQPGAFLVSDPEHAAPERARGYLIDDAQIARHAARHAQASSGLGAGTPEQPPRAAGPPQDGGQGPDGTGMPPGSAEGPEAALWAALAQAPVDGFPVWVLMAACRMSRSWVYYRLQEHADAGRAVQVTRGSWRAATPPPGGPSGHPG